MLRPLSTGELFWVRMCEKASNTFAFYCQLRGPMDRQKMVDAIARAAQVYPILGARVTQRDGQASLEIGQASRPQIKILERADADQWHRIMDEELCSRISVSGEALWRVTLLTGPDYSEIILSFNHLIGDGLSAVIFIEQILSIYGGAEPSPAQPIRESMEQLHRSDTFVPKRVKNFLLNIRDLVVGAKEKVYWLPVDPDVSPTDEGRTVFDSIALSEAESEHIYKAVKQHNITVYGAICSALSSAIYAESKAQNALNIGISSSVSLRSEMRENVSQDFGFYATNLDILTSVDQTTDFWQLAREYSEQVKKQIDQGKPMFGMGLLRMILKQYPDADALRKLMVEQARSTAMVTNMGRLDIKSSYGDLHLEQIFGLPSSHLLPRSLLVVAALSYEKKLRLTFSYPSPYTDKQSAQRIIADVVDRMKKLSV